MFKIPFYQTTWNGIDLMEIAKEVDLAQNTLPTESFYRRYYEKINAQPDLISQSWKDGKCRQSEWLEEQISAYGNKDSKIISIGAGFGLIELPLIEKGYKIELQDFQSSSFDYVPIRDITACYACDWGELPDESYDICYSMATSYAFDDQTLHDFADTASRILKPGGICFLMDVSVSWWETYVHARNFKKYREECVLWGYKRSFDLWKRAFQKFDILEKKYYERGMTEMRMKTFLGVPFNGVPYRQLMVFRKKDKK